MPKRNKSLTGELTADVIVVGGGLAGLSLTAALGSAGVNALCLDRETPAAQLAVKYDGRTTAVSYASQQILSAIGVWPLVEKESQPILDIRVTDGNSPKHLHFPSGAVNGEPFGWIVDNRELRRGLFKRLETLKDAHHLAPAAVKSIKAHPDYAEVMLTNGEVLTAKLIVGADGKDSLCREQAGIKTRTRAYNQSAIVCTIACEKPHEGTALENFRPAGPFAVLPMKPSSSGAVGQKYINKCSIVWSDDNDLAPHYLKLSDAEFVAELQDRIGDWLGKITLASPRFVYPLSLLHAARYTAPRLALISEAAHRMHPIAGQGLNIGMRDVALLAELVADALREGQDIGSEKLLKTYEQGRKTDTMAMLAGTDVLTHLFSNRSPTLTMLRRTGLAGVNRTTHLKGFFMRYAMGLVGPQTRLGQRLPL